MSTRPHYIKLNTQFTILSRTELRKKPTVDSESYCIIGKGMLVQYNGEPPFFDGRYHWSEVMYNYDDRKILVGWIPSHLVEPFTPSLQGYGIVATNEERVTLDLRLHNGKPNFKNMGQRVVLFCTENYDMSQLFETKASIKNKSTLLEIENMLHEFKGYPEKFTRVIQEFTYPDNRFLFTPYKAMERLSKYRIVLGCNFDRTFGGLTSYGVRGWLILKRVVPESRSGMATVYNSATNSLEKYSWNDLINSVGKRPQGILVPR
jgi:hypothetical protein